MSLHVTDGFVSYLRRHPITVIRSVLCIAFYIRIFLG